MFKIYINGTGTANLLFDVSKGIDLVDPVLTLNDGDPDEFRCTVLPDNPNYSQTELFGARITIDEEETVSGVTTTEGRFRGRIISVKTDMYGRRTIVCEGALAYLADIPYYAVESGTLVSTRWAQKLDTLLSAFSAYVGDSTRAVTTNLTSFYANAKYWYPLQNLEFSVLDFLKRCASDYDQHLWAAYRSAKEEAQGATDLIYIRMLDDASLPSASQKIKYGENMVSCDITETIKNTFLTYVRPFGAEDQNYDANRVEIANEVIPTTNNIRGGGETMVQHYGWVEKAVIWNDISDETTLENLGTEYVNQYAKEGYEIDVQAVDAHYSDPSITKFKVRTKVNVVHTALGINENVPVKSIELHLTSPKNNIVRCTKVGTRKLTALVQEVKPLA